MDPERVKGDRPSALNDAKKGLTGKRLEARRRAIDQAAAAALSLDVWDELGREHEEEPSPIDQALLLHAHSRVDRLPVGHERELVREAIELGAHVFLTRDKNVLRKRDDFKPCRLLLASPSELAEELVASRAMLATQRLETAHWLVRIFSEFRT
jgi:hypothetical protein